MIEMLGIMTIVLLYAHIITKYYRANKDIKSINEALSEITQGNYNMRFRITSSNKEINQLCIRLNEHMKNIQKTFARKRYLEEERKKLISNISHDLRTPLTSLLGYLEAVLTDHHLVSDHKEQYIQIAFNKANNLYQLIQDFFCLSKIESHDWNINCEKLDLVVIIENVVTTFYNDIIKSDLSLELDLPKESVFVFCDDKSIQRILHNLISNAIKYGSDGKVIGISLKKGSVYHKLSVWDCGKGISDADLPYIFKRLYTSDRSRNSHLKGSGLGLTIVKKLVDMQGGSIEVKSKPNEKTEFIVSLPGFYD